MTTELTTNGDDLRQLMSSTLLTLTPDDQPADLAPTLDGLQQFPTEAERAAPEETSPLAIPAWVYLMAVGCCHLALALRSHGMPLAEALMLGPYPIIMVGMIILVVHVTTGAGQACSYWLANGGKRTKHRQKKKR